MTDGSHHFSLLKTVFDQLHCGRMSTHKVGSISARDDNPIVFVDISITGSYIRRNRVPSLALVSHARLRTNSGNLSTFFPHSQQRIPCFHLLVEVLYENDYFLSL